MTELRKELDAMLKDGGLTEVKPIETPPVEPVVSSVEPSVVEPTVVEPPKTEPPKAEPPVTPEPVVPVVDVEADNQALRDKLNEMARQIQQGVITTPTAPPTTEPPKTEPLQPTSIESPPQGIMPPIFISKEEADLLIDKPDEVMPKILARVYEASRETVFREMQPYIVKMISNQVDILRKVEKFYTENKDLVNYKDFVGLVGTAIEQEHPDWNIDQVFTESAKVARERLRLKASAEAPLEEPSGDLQNPALPKTRGARGPRTTPQVTDESKQELNAMYEAQVGS